MGVRRFRSSSLTEAHFHDEKERRAPFAEEKLAAQ